MRGDRRTCRAGEVDARFAGEADLVKTLQQLPGVAVGTEGMTGLYVRGGGADENLYLLDGNPVYHVNHLLGFSRRSTRMR